MYQHILVTMDGSKTAEAVLPRVREAASPWTKVMLLEVAEVEPAVVVGLRPLVVGGPPEPGATVRLPGPRTIETRGQAIERVRAGCQEYLEGVAAPLRDAGLDVQTQVVFGEPAKEILAFAGANDVDLIVMATHGRSAIGRVIFGSVAQEVVKAGLKPVLLVRPTELS